MKTSLAILLMGILLSGCNTTQAPKFFQGEECSPQLIPGPDDIPETFTPVCRCRQYRIDIDRVGPVCDRFENGRCIVKVIRREIGKCNLVKGFVPSTHTDLVNSLDAWRIEIKKRSRKKAE